MHRIACALAILLAIGVATGCGENTSNVERSSDDPAPNREQSDQERYDAAVRRFEEGTFTIRYESTMPDMPGTVVMTIYLDGEEKTRSDIRYEVDDEEMPVSSLITISTPSRTAVCTESVGAFVLFLQLRDRSCIDASTIGAQAQDRLVSQSPLGGLEQDGRVTGRTEREIAGEHAECFSLTLEAEDDEEEDVQSEVCFGKSGALLSWRSLDDNPVEVTATEVSTSVDDEVFELPYPLVGLFTLEIRNDASVPIFVHAYSAEFGDWYVGEVEIGSSETGTLEAGAAGDPTKIYLGTYESPQWSWTCSWDDAKSNEPLIVSDGSANCTDTSSDR
jgi:hypothetical protein